MKQVVIENRVINSRFDEPKRQFRFFDEGTTNEILTQLRKSAYFIPIAAVDNQGKLGCWEFLEMRDPRAVPEEIGAPLWKQEVRL